MQWQYQDSVEPILPRKYARGWFPAMPDMVSRARVLPVALLVAASAFVPAPVQAVPTVDKWGQPLSTPTRQLARFDYATGAERPLEIPRSQHLTWFPGLRGPLPPPVRPDYLTGAERPLEVPRSQHITWYQPLSEPARRLQPPTPGTGAESPPRVEPLVVVQLAWLPSLSEPSRSLQAPLPGTGADAPIRPAPARLTWLQPLSEPLQLARLRSVTTGAESPVRVALVIPPITWLQPLSEPVTAIRLRTTATGAERPFRTALSGTAGITWLQPLSVPPPRLVRAGELTVAAPVLPTQRVSPPISWLPVIEPLIRVTPAIQLTQWTVEEPLLPTPTEWDSHNNIQPSIVVYMWRRIS